MPASSIARLILPAIASIALLMPASASAEVISTTPLPYCSTASTQNCIELVQRNGVDVAEADPTYEVSARSYAYSGAKFVAASVQLRGGGAGLDPADRWVVRVNTGATHTQETSNRGDLVSVTRGGNSTTGFTVQWDMHPVRMAFTSSGCGGTGACPMVAGALRTGVWEGVADDGGFATDPTYWSSLVDYDFSSSTDWASTRLNLAVDHTIELDVSNAHFEPDGTTPFLGSVNLHLPFTMLSTYYDVDDPGALAPAAFSVTTGGTTGATSVAIVGSAVNVRITGLTFSKRRLRIVGRTQPARPRLVSGARLSPTAARIRVGLRALSRGSRVRGYRVSCRRRGFTRNYLVASTTTFTLRATGLPLGSSVTCTVRALSRAGLGLPINVAIPANA